MLMSILHSSVGLFYDCPIYFYKAIGIGLKHMNLSFIHVSQGIKGEKGVIGGPGVQGNTGPKVNVE